MRRITRASVPLLLSATLHLAWSGPPIRVLSSLPLGLERGYSGPLHLLECFGENEGFFLEASRYEFGIPFRGGYRLWSIRPGSDGNAVVTPLEAPGSAPSITTGYLDPGSDVRYLIAVDGSGDTLWTCRLDGTDEFSHSPLIASDGFDYAVCIDPDCHDDRAGFYRVAGSGDLVFSNWISNRVFLGLPETPGENSPIVKAVRFLSGADLLISGYVSEWITTPAAWFVCRLDGSSGELVWKAFGFGLGEAWANDVLSTSSGLVIAVGGTREAFQEEYGLSPMVRGETRPLLLILSDSGDVIESILLGRDIAGELQGIAADCRAGGRFFVTGSDGTSDRTVLLEMEIPVDPAAWAASGPSVVVDER